MTSRRARALAPGLPGAILQWMRPVVFVVPALLAVLGCGSSSTDTAPADAGVEAAPPTPLSEQIAISEVANYEVVKVDVMKDGGAAGGNAPIITKKPGLFRVYLSFLTRKRWLQHSLDAELHLVDPFQHETVLTAKATVAGASDDAVLGSTFNFPFDDKLLTTGAWSFWVKVSDPSRVGTDDLTTIRYPDADGTQSFTVLDNPGPVHIVFVPIQYDADGSSRLPATDPTQMTSIHQLLSDMYPSSDIQITLHDPVTSSIVADASGTGWDETLQLVLDTRQADAPSGDVYYVGAFEPQDSFPTYCKQGCILGLAPIATLGSEGERGALVVGWPGYTSQETVAHELGHTMGRAHSPCGHPAGIDPKFPYPDGSVGVSGFQASSSSLVTTDATDVMGYCQPTWISDYTYTALYQRIRQINLVYDVQGTLPPPQRYARWLIGADGTPRRMGTVLRNRPPEGKPMTLTYTLSTGATRTVTGAFFPYDHLPGGYLLAPDLPLSAKVSIPALPR